MQEEAAVTALHHRDPEPYQAGGSVAQVVVESNRALKRIGTEQDIGDFAIGGTVEPSVQRAQG